MSIFVYKPAKNEKGVYFVCYYSFLFVYTCDTDSVCHRHLVLKT